MDHASTGIEDHGKSAGKALAREGDNVLRPIILQHGEMLPVKVRHDGTAPIHQGDRHQDEVYAGMERERDLALLPDSGTRREQKS